MVRIIFCHETEFRIGCCVDSKCRLPDVIGGCGGSTCSQTPGWETTCRTCYNTHDYRNAQVPVRRKAKKDDNKTLMSQVLESMPMPASPAPPPIAVKKRRDLWADVERLKKK